ncbi:MAG: VWA domain-containing protein [Actinobacteria bacterium]|nr:VWA domain-containing protein [Actinomycetota bacterium]
MNRDNIVYPFSAVVGQQQVRTALLLNAISPAVGGVLIRGRRGTAKSTLARGLAHLLPEQDIVSNCPFSCDPGDIESLCNMCAEKLAREGSLPAGREKIEIITLPLNATEEMVVGTLDIQKALQQGEKCIEPGILAKANRSILYVDEVNLLEDHIVDVLLDSAAMGVNVVEREGISFKHGARFILVGTMNPEEGDLRPQLEDRFGLCADVDESTNVSDRTEILKRNLEFSKNPLDFESCWHQEQERLRSRILEARELLGSIEVSRDILELVAWIVEHTGADGHRADISMVQAALALAAYEGKKEVTEAHLKSVAPLAINHRIRKGPLGLEENRFDVQAVMEKVRIRKETPQADPEGNSKVEAPASPVSEDRGTVLKQSASLCSRAESTERIQAVPEKLQLPERETPGLASGRRGLPKAQDLRGRYYRSMDPGKEGMPVNPSNIAMDATIRASAARGCDENGKLDILPEDLKLKLKKRKCGASILFVVDASASMGVQQRLEASRQAILSLLVDAYQKRDRVGLVVFKDESAQLVMSPTASPSLASRLLANLPAGGTTPLSQGLTLAYHVMSRELSRKPKPDPFLVLISDGCGNVSIGKASPIEEALKLADKIKDKGIRSIVLDSAPSLGQNNGTRNRVSTARRIALQMGGRYYPVQNFSGKLILDRVVESTS